MQYRFKTQPFSHQKKTFDETRTMREYAIFWEQGTGKTKITIDTACWNFQEGNIDGLLVVAPNGVHLNWVTDELPAHVPDYIMERTRSHVFQSSKANTAWHIKAVNNVVNYRGFSVLTMSYDSFMTEKGKKVAWDFLRKRKVMFVLDESRRIKTPGAKRTKSIVAAGKYAVMRRVLDGTPVANGPFDLYSLMRFLDDDFWKIHELDNFALFKQHFGKFQKIKLKDSDRTFDKLTRYRRLGELNEIISYVSSRVTKDEVLDLPPKLFQKRYFEMTPQQSRLYEQIRDEYMAELESESTCPECEGTGRVEYVEAGQTCSWQCERCEGTGKAKGALITAPLAITRLLRLQQITCGYIPYDGGDPVHWIDGGNPRLDALLELAGDTPHCAIIWARFRMDIDLIMDGLKKVGLEAVRYDGKVSNKDRAFAKEAFQKKDVQYFVANPAAASEGLTLNSARSVLYYNNSFKLTDRLQSEDRAHRIGQEHPVNYYDIIAPGTVDEKLVKALRMKYDVAVQITGDKLKEWL